MNGRQARKLLKSIAVANLRRGDTLACRVRSAAEVDTAASALRVSFPGVPILLLLPGQSLSVLRGGIARDE